MLAHKKHCTAAAVPGRLEQAAPHQPSQQYGLIAVLVTEDTLDVEALLTLNRQWTKSPKYANDDHFESQ